MKNCKMKTIVRTPAPFLKGGNVNFNYLPQRGRTLKIIKKEWKYGAGAALMKKLTDINGCLTDPANRCLTDV